MSSARIHLWVQGVVANLQGLRAEELAFWEQRAAQLQAAADRSSMWSRVLLAFHVVSFQAYSTETARPELCALVAKGAAAAMASMLSSVSVDAVQLAALASLLGTSFATSEMVLLEYIKQASGAASSLLHLAAELPASCSAAQSISSAQQSSRASNLLQPVFTT